MCILSERKDADKKESKHLKVTSTKTVDKAESESSTSRTTDGTGNKPTLLNRLGGTNTLRVVLDDFYTRLFADDRLAFFFDDVRMSLLKIHQLNFLKLAFTGVPEGVDVGAMMLSKHERLFRTKGLNANHFDMVATHLVCTLQHFEVTPKLIDEVVAIVVPLRSVFEKGAEQYGTKDREPQEEQEKKQASPPRATTTV
jgi:hemoglobin